MSRRYKYFLKIFYTSIAETVVSTENTQKKFESGFSECVRQVELFLGSIMDPQLMRIEENLKTRLKDHLWRNLQGLQNPVTEIADRQKEILSPPSASSTIPVYDISSQSYKKSSPSVTSYKDASVENTIDLSFHSSKKRKSDQTDVYSCSTSQSVAKSQTLEEKTNHHDAPSFRAIAPSNTIERSYSSFDDYNADMRVPEEPLFNMSLDRSDEGQSSCSFYPTSTENSPGGTNLQANSIDNHYHQHATSHTSLTSSPIDRREETFDLKQKYSTFDSNGSGNFIHQIPLMPRRLQNGEWALVLPGSLAMTEHEIHNPLSAFRFVLPSCAAEVDRDQLGRRQRSVSSPLSSSVSDMSAEEYSSRSDGEISVKFEYDGQNDTFQCMWRPW